MRGAELQAVLVVQVGGHKSIGSTAALWQTARLIPLLGGLVNVDAGLRDVR